MTARGTYSMKDVPIGNILHAFPYDTKINWQVLQGPVELQELQVLQEPVAEEEQEE